MIGSITTLEDLKGRCWIDPKDPGHAMKKGPCWHLRLAGGGKPKRALPRLWLPALQQPVNATTAAWILSHPGKTPNPKLVRYHTCTSQDCANPEHVRQGTRQDANDAMARRGGYATEAREAMADRLRKMHKPALTPELQAWAAESRQSNVDAGWGLGVSHFVIYTVRKRWRQGQARARELQSMSSVFAWASRSCPPSPLLGKLRPGRTPEAVYEWLAAPGRETLCWSKDMIVQGTKATPKAVDWALLFLRSLGALEVTEDPRCGRYHRYRLAPGATVATWASSGAGA